MIFRPAVLCVTALAFLGMFSRARAEVRPSPLFSTGAVLQQDTPIPVWGTAAPGEAVSVELDQKSVSTTAAPDGSWRVQLPAHATGGPFTLTIQGAHTAAPLAITDVLVGEVWVCSGQSNMASLLRDPKPANFPQLRMFVVEKKPSALPIRELTGRWLVCSPETAAGFSAVGYFFGRDLHLATRRPVGMIHSSWGGTGIETWISLAAYEKNPALKKDAKSARAFADAYPQAAANYPADTAAYEARLARWEEKVGTPFAAEQKAWGIKNRAALAEGKPALPKLELSEPKPRPPAPPNGTQGTPSALFNGMIAPLTPYAIRGVIWYQGESNSFRPQEYKTLFTTLIADWRSQWGRGDFPFLFVQLPPHKVLRPELREAQFLTWQSTPNTGMAVTTDVGDAEDLHPKKKEPVGDRLALAARALAYGEKIDYSGPAYAALKIDGPRAILSFTHVDNGLVAQGGPLKGFTIAGADQVFVPAQAEIQNDTVVVTSDQVSAPVAVRYGWSNVPDVNLANQAGLPATPFRTDAPQK